MRLTPPPLLGRVMSALMLCAFGSFPLSVAISGVLVRHIGPSLFFPVAGGLLAVAILGGLTQREFREFGAGPREPKGTEEPLASQRGAVLSGLYFPRRPTPGATKERRGKAAPKERPGDERENRAREEHPVG